MPLNKVSAQRKNLPEDFNKCIQFIQNVQTDFRITACSYDNANMDANDNKFDNLFTECLVKYMILFENEYFEFMFINNLIIKEFTLKFLQIIIELQKDSESVKKLKSMAFKILCKLVEWDFSLEHNHFRNDVTKKIYSEYFAQIMPQIIQSLNHMNKLQNTPQLNSNTTSQASSLRLPNDSIFADEPKHDENLLTLNKLICFLFSSVSFGYLVKTGFLPNYLVVLFNQLLSPFASSQLMYTISNNICDYTYSNHSNEILEALRIEIHEKCSYQTLILMENNVRNQKSRNLLKKALNNYCQYITEHKKDLESKFEAESNHENIETYGIAVSTWQESLYRIVISIVKILRLEFENNTNMVEIDLVIYFYELLLTNLDGLTYEDSVNIAKKLMPVLIKINEWRIRETEANEQRENKQFSTSQSDYLYKLSFKLADKFMITLGHEFSDFSTKFEEIWLLAINDWYPMSFKIISTFCKCNKNIQSFDFIKKLATVVLTSWKDNYKLSKNGSNCTCGLKPKKKYLEFLSDELLEAMIELTHYYDFMIQNDLKYFQDFVIDMMPLLQAIHNLFNIIRSKNRLIMFNSFYSKLFMLHSSLLRSAPFWNNQIVSVILRLEKMIQSSLEFECDEKVYETTLNLIRSLTLCFDKNFLLTYNTSINDALIYIYKNSNANQTIQNELFAFFNTDIKRLN